MMDDLILRGAHVLTDAAAGPASVIRDGAILCRAGKVAEVGPAADLIARHPGVPVKGNGRQLLMPGLIDAHCHGRGLSPIQKGVAHEHLENALFDWAYMPVLPSHLCAGLTALRHLRGGCTTVHHNGFDDDGPNAPVTTARAIETYLASGIRLAFSPGLRNENKLALGEEQFLETLPGDLRQWAEPRVLIDKAAAEAAYFDLFDGLDQRFHGEDTRILFAPCWAHGATDGFLTRVKGKADQLGGRQIHMHLLQTPIQKAWGLKAHGKPTVEWLDDLGLLDRNVTFGHAIHVTASDIALLAKRGASVTTHPSCNFNMRNGMTPVWYMREAGVNVAMGMDDKTINDDEDAVMEVRMLHKLHRTPNFDLTVPPPDAYEALQMALGNAARVCGFEGELGALTPGMKADAILVDLETIENDPWIDPDFDIVEAFVHRGMGRDVATVVVGGKVVIEDRRFLSLDVDALYDEIRAVCARGLSPEHRAMAETMARIKPYAQAWYQGWEKGMLDEPFYRWNSQV